MVDSREYRDPSGRGPFRDWYDRLNSEAARKVTTALYRVGLGNFSNAKGVGAAFRSARSILAPVIECISAKKASRSSFLLAVAQNNGSKSDISRALERWEDYKHRKRNGRKKKKRKRNEHGFDARF
jgi:putative component of toxin-antitoxin plasmid stabilization module